MKTLIVDTDVVSYLFKRDTRADVYAPHLLNVLPAISFMTLAELERWALSANWGRAKYAELQTYLNNYSVIFPDTALCRLWAQVYHQVFSGGYHITAPDAWIAATALAYNVPLVTNNRKDFVAVQGLTLISAAP